MSLESLKECFLNLKYVWVRVWRPLTTILYLNRAAWVFLTHNMRTQGLGCVHMVKTYVCRRAYAHA